MNFSLENPREQFFFFFYLCLASRKYWLIPEGEICPLVKVLVDSRRGNMPTEIYKLDMPYRDKQSWERLLRHFPSGPWNK
jgi:hypothetical protein